MSTQLSNEPSAAGTSQVFARDSTGLVREVGPVSSAIYNLSYSSAPLALALAACYVGGNIFLAVILTLLLTLPTAFVFAMFTGAIPRSGGDYTWISRSLSPTLGFMSNFSYMVWAVFIIGVYAILVPALGIAPLFRFMSAKLNWSGALDVSDFLNGKGGTLIVGLCLVAAGAMTLIFSRGLRTYIRVQNYLFAFWGLALLVAVPLIMILTSHGGFDAKFDGYARDLGGPANAHMAVNSAPPPDFSFSLKQTVLLVTIPYYALGFIYQSAYFAGEMKRGRRGTLMSMPGAQVWVVVLAPAVDGASTSRSGSPRSSASS